MEQCSNKICGVVIGASKDAIHTIKRAKQQGIYVVALDGNADSEGFCFADEAIEVDISNKDKVCEVISEINPDFMIPIPIGRCLSTMGYVNDKFGLVGVNYYATELSTDKYKFHARLNEFGLRNIQMILVNAQTEIESVNINYPVIMKPRFGSGSRDVYYINSDRELRETFVFVKDKKEDFVLEQAVSGIEYGIDGAVIEGKLQITLLRKKMITPLPVRQAISSLSIVKNMDNEKMFEKVQNYMQKVVDALQYNNCLVNADIIINNEEIFVIEIAPRPSGHNLHNKFVPLVTGVDIAEEYINFLLGKEFGFVPDKIKSMQIRFFDFSNKNITFVPNEAEIREVLGNSLIEWNCNINEGQYLENVIDGHSIMGRGYFIIEGNDEKDLLSKSAWVLNQYGME